MMKKLGFSSGTPTPASTRTAPAAAPKPTAPAAPARPAPAAAPAQGGNDGFNTRAAPSSGSHVPTASSSRGLNFPPGKDVATNFQKDPTTFMANNTLNANNSDKNSKDLTSTNPKERVPAPKDPNVNPFVSAQDSRVTMNVHQQPGGNANMSFSPLGNKGETVHFMPYVQQGEGTFGGVNQIPVRPGPGDPKMVVTGPLNGCAVHAFRDNSNNTLSFVHQANFSKTGDTAFNDFKAKNPNLQHLHSIRPEDYSHQLKNGKPGQESGATVFAHYDEPKFNKPGQWKLSAQLNEQTGNFQHLDKPLVARPELKSPELAPGANGEQKPLHIQHTLT